MLKFDESFLQTKPVVPACGISDKILLNSAAYQDQVRLFLVEMAKILSNIRGKFILRINDNSDMRWLC